MRITKNSWLNITPIAHRGLWNDGIVENSLEAYSNAVKNGFPIEIDLYLSTDGILYSFHDKDLFRMTGVNGLIYEKSSIELDKLKLIGCDETIPTFDSVLKVVSGKVPILIEIKDQPDKSVVDKVCERLKSYKGEFAIQSFNPLYIKRVKKIAPEYIRGILTTTNEKDLEGVSKLNKFVIKHTALNFLCKPDFLSCNKESFPRKTKLVTLAWTVETNDELDKLSTLCNNVIFEKFIPNK